jgi:hypothetical protein
MDLSDCRQISHQDDLVTEQFDAKGLNLNKFLEDERSIFYNWGRDQFHFSRGRALIFRDDLILNHSLRLAQCFKDLDYHVKLSAVKNIRDDICILLNRYI